MPLCNLTRSKVIIGNAWYFVLINGLKNSNILKLKIIEDYNSIRKYTEIRN